MATLTDNAANAALDAMGALHVQLHVGDPTNAGTAAPSTGLTGRTAAGLGAAAARARTNTADVTTAAGATAAETITHVSLWTAATGGSCSWRGPLTAPKAVAVGEKFRLVAGALVVTIT